ncbi:MAG: Ni/Fe hydrogenase subunit alpha [Nitrospirota bacterium]|nr:Ni/Fe hydrogenase subunit alpha [Nitrospirota bacterium]
MKINIDYIARVEGEGAVKLDIEDGTLKDLKLNIWEPPRFFEGFLCNRSYDEVPDIVARICGICPVSHMTTAIRALEKALGFTPSRDSITLRRVMALSQIVSSHLVHLYMLALPDYHRLCSIPDMFSRFESEIKRLNRMKEVVNKVTALFGGRPLHPVSMVVGGFTSLPPRDKIEKIVGELENIKDDAKETLKMVSALPFPDFTYNTEYVAISSPAHYAINGGIIVSQNGIRMEEDEYYSIFEEDEISYSNAKRTVIKGKGSFMVGALARLNLKFNMLHRDAKKAAEEIGFKVPDYNPFHNNLAQAIEIVHGISECRELLEGVHFKKPEIVIKVREGEGIAITEAPRGLLCHHYVLNRRGVVERANIVTPTAHNFLGLEENLKRLVQQYIHEDKEEIALKCEMLVRAYDPCFSCSVH